ncbi:hypothetical protein EYF80_056603 [Liparis tanakae]|uniref:Uncharacterized protein n=1 Tax=Liparis tanakae TaxID=230148 RepID=A0A4Z2EWA4_9TELE|nr:hypothetical protein EYF80_056603 [Liparis tanakae]
MTLRLKSAQSGARPSCSRSCWAHSSSSNRFQARGVTSNNNPGSVYMRRVNTRRTAQCSRIPCASFPGPPPHPAGQRSRDPQRAPRAHPARTPRAPRAHPARTPRAPRAHPARTPRAPRAHPAPAPGRGTWREALDRQLLTSLGVFTADSRHVEPGRRSQSAAESQHVGENVTQNNNNNNIIIIIICRDVFSFDRRPASRPARNRNTCVPIIHEMSSHERREPLPKTREERRGLLEQSSSVDHMTRDTGTGCEGNTKKSIMVECFVTLAVEEEEPPNPGAAPPSGVLAGPFTRLVAPGRQKKSITRLKRDAPGENFLSAENRPRESAQAELALQLLVVSRVVGQQGRHGGGVDLGDEPTEERRGQLGPVWGTG